MGRTCRLTPFHMPSDLVFRHSLLRQTWEPQTSPVVAAGVHDPALITVIVHAVMALLVAEKGPGPSSSNLRGNSLSVEPQVPAPPPSLLQQTVTFLNSGDTFPGNRQYLQLQPCKVGLILLCHPLLPLLQPRTH